MKSYLILINFVLSFSALVMTDADNTSLRALLLIIIWFIVSAIWAGRTYNNQLKVKES